ncbi:MAG TPA: CPBP family intramembrane glutamic endopeptidase, partial [Polyangiaceae bacterium]
WWVGVTVGWVLTLNLVVGISRGSEHDLVTLVGGQAAVYLGACALFAARRPGRSWSEVFAFRRTSIALILIALLLGVALYAPAQLFATLVERWFPLPKQVVAAEIQRLTPKSIVHGVALGLMVIGVGPFVEELFFRGALYTVLRSVGSAFAAVGTTALLFTLGHLEPRTWLPIFTLAVALGYVRALSGSFWPGLLLHAAFNGTALGMSLSTRGDELAPIDAKIVIGSSAASVVLLGLTAWIGKKSAAAARARALDEIGPSGGEALP